jgi:hypothetical protein
VPDLQEGREPHRDDEAGGREPERGGDVHRRPPWWTTRPDASSGSVAEVAALAILAVEREACVERAHMASVLV